jgi:hypothetical protein
MVLVGLLVSVFLLFEARRYRYFNVWRARARLLETDFYAPMIRGEGGLGAAVGRRQRNARRDHRPVGRAVEARAPNRASVDFTSVEMSKCANLCGTELRLSSGLKRRLVRIG